MNLSAPSIPQDGKERKLTYLAAKDAYAVSGTTVPRHALVSQTDRCIRELVDAVHDDRRPHPSALRWLRAVGITDGARLQRWLDEVRPALVAAPDPTRIVHCRFCGFPLTAARSKARGYGRRCAKERRLPY